jgi:ubiquinone/menaquinone biosynthesis C-methylase UbiE
MSVLLTSSADSTRLKPAWAGDDWLAKAVNLLIRTKPLYGVMKQQARKVLINTAEKNGVPWRKAYGELASAGLQQQIADLTNPDIVYPDYYQVPFHAYDAGNLCWDAAFEAESATYAMALRVWIDEPLTWQDAQDRLRRSFYQLMAAYYQAHTPSPVRDALDIGCSVGISTLTLHDFLQAAGLSDGSLHTVGLDLSPYMLSVARHRDGAAQVSQWLHAKAEDTGLDSGSFDLITMQFVIHELPRSASLEIFRECLRLLRSGGTLAIVDNNPESEVIRNLPPVLFTLMKSTEPWSDDYYTFDVAAALREAGFAEVLVQPSDPRHRTITARCP